MVRWVANWLRDKTHLVKVEGAFLESMKITSGVLQASVLGVMLFDIYFSDSSTGNQDLWTNKIADDYKLNIIIKSPSDAHALQQDVIFINNWFMEKGLKFNAKKCTIVTFYKWLSQLMYSIANAPLQNDNALKDLGIWTDNSFSFDHDVATVVRIK